MGWEFKSTCCPMNLIECHFTCTLHKLQLKSIIVNEEKIVFVTIHFENYLDNNRKCIKGFPQARPFPVINLAYVL